MGTNFLSEDERYYMKNNDIDLNKAYDLMGKLLNEGEFSRVIAIGNDVIKKEYEIPEFYQMMLLAEMRVRKMSELRNVSTPLEACKSYNKAILLSNEDVADYIRKCNKLAINKYTGVGRNSEKQKNYNADYLDYDNSNETRNVVEKQSHISQNIYHPKWVTAKLILSIISIVIFMIVTFQSCAAGLGNAILNTGESSGSFGFISAVFFLIAGIVGLCIRRKGVGGHITVTIFYYLILLFAAVGAGSYGDLKVWGVIAFAFGSIFLFSAIRTKKGYISSGVAAVVFFIVCIITMSSANDKNVSENKAQSSISDMSVTADTKGTEDVDFTMSNKQINDNDDNNSNNADSNLATISETVLLDNSGVIIKAVEMVDDAIWGQGIKLYIENNSDKNVGVACEALIVNDFMITDLFSSSVASGKKTNEVLYLSNMGLRQSGIDNVGKIEVYFKLYDSDSWEDIYKSDCIKLETSDYTNMDTTVDDAGKEIFNDKDIRIIAKYVDEDTFWGKSILLYMENNFGKNITISVDNMSVNGFMVTPLFASTIYSGKKSIDEIDLMSSELETNGITSIDEVEMSFHIYDSDTYDTIIDSEPIVFNTRK